MKYEACYVNQLRPYFGKRSHASILKKTPQHLHSSRDVLVMFQLISKVYLMQSQHGSIASFNRADFVYKLIWLEEGSQKGQLS